MLRSASIFGCSITFMLVVFAAPAIVHAQPPGWGGPSLVAAAPGREGVLAPQVMRKGTVFFKEMAEVATEVAGKVVEVNFEEGERVEAGTVLVHLDDSVLLKELSSKKATVARYVAELSDAQARFDRAESLVADEITTPQQLDQLRFEVESDRQQVESMRAEVGRVDTLVAKNSIRAPFAGVVVERPTELGEWKSVGETVAILAREHLYDVIVSVPEPQLRWLQPGAQVSVELSAAGRTLGGTVVTVIPRSDMASNLFPVKVRVETEEPLYEGMNAEVYLPNGESAACLFVPRDALLRVNGRYVLYTIGSGKAVRHDVSLLGYDGGDDQWAAVDAPELTVDDRFIVKGQERLRDGDAVRVPDNGESSGVAPLSADG